MRRLKIFWISALALVVFASVAQAAQTVYIKHARTGGGADAVDGIDGNVLVDKDTAFSVENDVVYWYENDADGSCSESNPDYLVPDANPGTNCWVLKGKLARTTYYEGSSEIVGGVSTYAINGNMTLSGLQLAGRVLEVKGSVPYIVNLGNLSSGVTGIAVFHDVTTAGDDGGVTVFCPTTLIYEGTGSGRTSGTTIFVNSGNSGFWMTLKETTIGWEIVSYDCDDIKRP